MRVLCEQRGSRLGKWARVRKRLSRLFLARVGVTACLGRVAEKGKGSRVQGCNPVATHVILFFDCREVGLKSKSRALSYNFHRLHIPLSL